MPIDTPFSVTFTTDINPATVTVPKAVRLYLAESAMADMPHPDDPAATDPSMDTMPEIFGTPSYNAQTRTLTFVPNNHLETGEDYHFVLTGLKTTANATLTLPPIKFRTLNNAEMKSVRYDTSTNPPTVRSTTVYVRDGNGRVTSQTRYDGAETTPPVSVTDFITPTSPAVSGIRLPAGVTLRSVTYDGTKTTITRYTASVTEGTTTYRVNVSGKVNPAPNTWDFATDLVSGYSSGREPHNVGTGSHLITTSYRATAQGGAPWSQRATAFTVENIQLRQLNAQGRTERIVNYASLGANNQVDTTPNGDLTRIDDVITSYRKIDRDLGTGRRTTATTVGARARGTTLAQPPTPGPDGAWFTGDDLPIVEVEEAKYDNQGHRTAEIEYSGPGADLDWKTLVGNVVGEYDVYQYSGNALQFRRSYVPGPDNVVDSNLNGVGDVLEREETYDTRQ